MGGHTYISGSAAFGITERSRKIGRKNKKYQKISAGGGGGGMRRCEMMGNGRWTADGAVLRLAG